MPMPTFPQIDPPLTREGSINGIISSIAAEELSLSHILNTQGEKLQYVLGTLPGLE
ncbi:MAG: collagen-like protein, partial [Oscillospiraceae bacterium]|nr:collagen-like protein [Oscillospiraceae bacterium]